MTTPLQDQPLVDRPEARVLRARPVSSSPKPFLVSGGVPKQNVTAKSSFAPFPHETEDCRMTGGTRSLIRRLLGLNVEGTLGEKKVSRTSAEPTSMSSRNPSPSPKIA